MKKTEELQVANKIELAKYQKLQVEIQELRNKKDNILRAVPEIQGYLDLKMKLRANLTGGRTPKPPDPKSTLARGLRELEKSNREIIKTEKLLRNSDEKLAQLRLEAALQGVELAVFVVHNDDYTSFTFDGKPYFVRAPQGRGIKLLHEEGMAGRPDVPQEDIKKVMGLSPTSDLRDSFRRAGLWKTLIVSEKQKTCRLDIFS